MTAEPSLWQTITDSRAAAFLVDAEQSQYFVPFLDRECTVKQLSEEVPCTALQAYRAVDLMEQLGLIQLVRKITRRGKPIKVYTSTARALFVPFKYAPHNSFEDMMLSRDNTWRELLFHSLMAQFHEAADEAHKDLGLRFVRHNGKAYVVQALGSGEDGSKGLIASFGDPEAPAIRDDWRVLKLSREQAKELQQEFYELIHRYAGQQEGRDYILRVALAPYKEK
ncbi:hypothetical protein [Deinococcus cellulosilyticus]|uniref:Uncharacterized protein n=1 Tax=Deinococcus cellulosilyticus (strain DSM 18568 / NBRC 106333 / KACC 11606 / 5516J-15) TaxID=1223518 RepID=A0A511MXB2_DEIC1|nr:hypothetical protein [Deinococcus cellulosilyticus]GEM45200.1 hypothetical protein DC3_08350 [Deinococcus cellulosilyticus NBRC 106333 = KACC 11606]